MPDNCLESDADQQSTQPPSPARRHVAATSVDALPPELLQRIFALVGWPTPSVLQKVCKKWAEAVASPGVLYEHLEIDAKGYPAAYRPAAQHDVHAWVRRRIGEATTSAVIANFAYDDNLQQSPEPTLHAILLELARAPRLRSLTIGGCHNVLGSLNFAAARYLTSLQCLLLEHLCGPIWRPHLDKGIAGLANLSDLHLSFQHKGGCPQAVQPCGFPTALLRCTKLTRLAILAEGGEAGSQLLAFGALPAGVFALAGLQQLTLVNAGVTGLPLEISTLRSLKVLEVLQSRGTPAQRYDAYDAPIPLPPPPKLAVPTGALAPLPALARLALSSVEAPAAAFAAPALEALWLDQVQTMTPHNGGAPSPLAAVSSLTVLTELRLSKATLQDVDYAAVAARGSALDCLQLDGCGLVDLPSPLEPLLLHLSTLDLSRNQLRAAPDVISGMLDCKLLDLSFNNFVSPGGDAGDLFGLASWLTAEHELETLGLQQEASARLEYAHGPYRRRGGKLRFTWSLVQVQAMMDLQHKVSQRPGKLGLNLLLDETVEHEELQELRPYEAWLEMPVKAK